ncbi:single-stranded DNA-binding protein [Paractinoplanes maris]|uniref:single-stranded DNA-binding protein n=1 Tax=Paractinoplanes maris TaxID=1734446 RepID=UPI002022561A|nr:single-stranded DNA-binding protein [Actinoplanes maris]
MAQGDINITVVGNLVADPELRFTPSGAGVAQFTIASTPRQLDKQSGEWKDGTPTFLDCKVWRDAAEHVAESLQRGARVIVTGRLKQENWEDKQTGQKRSKLALEVDEIGPSLRYATAKIQKMTRSNGGSQPAQSQSGGGDPWATQAAQPDRGFGGRQQQSNDQEPPF